MRSLFNGRYAVDSAGNVYSFTDRHGGIKNTPQPLKLQMGRAGYLSVVLVKEAGNPASKTCQHVHRLVAEAFLSNPLNKPCVNHKNGVKTDNSVNNLEWVTRSENDLHAFRTKLRTPNLGGTGKFNEAHPKSRPVNQLTLNGTFIQRFPSIREAARAGFSQGNISSVISGKRNHSNGFKWEFAEVTVAKTLASK